MKLIRAYLRASTKEQDAERAKDELSQFVKNHDNCIIVSFYTENESGTKQDRPELERLISDSNHGDIILLEKMDRLTRLPYVQWKTLKARLMTKGIQIICIDQPMTHLCLQSNELSPIAQALTEFLLDIGASMARDDYETRNKRQAQGIKSNIHKFKGRQRNEKLWGSIKTMLIAGNSYTNIENILGCSRSTIAQVSKELKSITN